MTKNKFQIKNKIQNSNINHLSFDIDLTFGSLKLVIYE